MYQNIFKIIRAFGLIAAIIFLLAGVIEPLQQFLGLNTVKGLFFYGAVLSGVFLLDRHLGRLAFSEAAKEMEDVDLDQLRANFRKENGTGNNKL